MANYILSASGSRAESKEPLMEATSESVLGDPLSMFLLPSSAAPGPSLGDSFPTSDMSQPSFMTTGTAISTPAAVTIQENAATAQHMLDEYNRIHTVPPVRKDMNFSFPPGLFSNEVNLVDSEYPYRHLLQELDNPAEFIELFKQIPANPLKLSNAFQDLDLLTIGH